MEDIIVQYVKSLSAKKSQRFKMYFKGYEKITRDDESGLYLIEDANLSQQDKNALARKLYGKLLDTLDFKKITEELEK